MKQKITGLTLSAMLFALSLPAHAQQPKKVPRIGYLSGTEPATDSRRAETIRRGLRDLGYIEGQNIAIEYRYAEEKRDRFPELAAELVRLKADIIVVAGWGRTIRAAETCDKDDSHRYGGLWRRSCRGRSGGEPCPSGRQRHRPYKPWPRTRR